MIVIGVTKQRETKLREEMTEVKIQRKEITLIIEKPLIKIRKEIKVSRNIRVEVIRLMARFMKSLIVSVEVAVVAFALAPEAMVTQAILNTI
jgi:hypothetical protein